MSPLCALLPSVLRPRIDGFEAQVLQTGSRLLAQDRRSLIETRGTDPEGGRRETLARARLLAAWRVHNRA